MKSRVLVLGAGFGGMELSTLLSEALGEKADVTVIEKGDSFVFGYSKIDLMFGRATSEAVCLPYRNFVKPGVRLVQETITAIDPAARRVTTSGGTYEADFLVVALGADYDLAATPGLAEDGYEFYSVAGASRLREVLPAFSKGPAIVGVSGFPYKCPPAPSECALMLHHYLATRGVRGACEITLVIPLSSPMPASADLSADLVAAFAERGIKLLLGRSVKALEPGRKTAVHGRKRLGADHSAHAGDALPQRVRHWRRGRYGNAEGRIIRGERGARSSEFNPRQNQGRRGNAQLGDGQLPGRVRRRSPWLGGPGFPDRAETQEYLPPAFDRRAGS